MCDSGQGRPAANPLRLDEKSGLDSCSRIWKWSDSWPILEVHKILMEKSTKTYYKCHFVPDVVKGEFLKFKGFWSLQNLKGFPLLSYFLEAAGRELQLNEIKIQFECQKCHVWKLEENHVCIRRIQPQRLRMFKWKWCLSKGHRDNRTQATHQ